MITLSRFYRWLGLPEIFNILKFLGQKEQTILQCAQQAENYNFCPLLLLFFQARQDIEISRLEIKVAAAIFQQYRSRSRFAVCWLFPGHGMF